GAFAAAVRATNKRLQVTIDDGVLGGSSRIREVLRKHKVRTMFFLVGQHIEAHGAAGLEEVRAIVRDGHTLGNHSYLHENFDKAAAKGGPGAVADSLRRAEAVIHKAIPGYPVQPDWRAPGFDALTSAAQDGAAQAGYTRYHGAPPIDPKDYDHLGDAAAILQ